MIKIILPLVALASIATVFYLQSKGDSESQFIISPTKLQKIAKKINSSNLSWKANPKVKKVFNKERMFNLMIDPIPEGFDPMPTHLLRSEELPKEFDARKKWPDCKSISLIRDQSSCGSCWAFGAVEAMSDRVCITSGGKNQTLISSEDLMECCDSCGYGCNGGYLYESWMYFKEEGISSGGLYQDMDTCKPYEFTPCAHHVDSPDYKPCSDYHFDTPSCRNKCTSKKYKKKYKDDKVKGKSAYSVVGEDYMMKELFENGPFEIAISVYEDFLTYKEGVYQQTEGSFLGGHAIRILGYGVEDGVKYWLCANSWNEEWGDKGYIKIRRGTDECGIESQGVGG